MTNRANYTRENAEQDVGPSLEGFFRELVEEKFVEPLCRRERRKAEQILQQQKGQEWRAEKHQLLVGQLLGALLAKSIQLPKWQKVALRELPSESLPAIAVAVKAKNAGDFARRAGLQRKPNGGAGNHE